MFSLSFTSCWEFEAPASFPAGEVEGYVPVFDSDPVLEVTYEEYQAILNPGKIYIYQQYLLLADTGLGIHVFDNSNPTNPLRIGFIKLEGVTDIAMKGNIIYADQFTNLVSIDISDIQKPIVLDRKSKLLGDYLLPPHGYYFECAKEETKEQITGWKLTTLNNPECYR